LLLLLVLPLRLLADVEFSARAGLGGKARENTWVPIIVDVECRAENIEGIVEAVLPDERGDSVHSVCKVRMVGSARKRFFIYIRHKGYQTSVPVRLVSRGEIIRETEVPLFLAGPETALIGLCGKGGSDVDRILGAFTAGNVVKTVINVEELPDRWLGYDGLSALLLLDVDLNKLSLPQRRALSAWVRTGGQLVLIIGENWASTKASFISDIMPIHFTERIPGMNVNAFAEFNSVGVEGTEAVKYAKGTLRDSDAEIILGSAARPLAVRAEVGFGIVTVVAFDVGDYPFSSWPGRGTFVRKLFLIKGAAKIPEDKGGTFYPYAYREEAESLLLRFIEKVPGMRAIPWPLAAAVVALYVLVACFLDYRILKKRNLLKLTWLTFAGYAVVFSMVAFLLSLAIKGGAQQQKSLTMVDVSVEDGIARGQTYIGIFNAQEKRYDFVSQNRSIFPSVLGFDYGMGSAGALGGDYYYLMNEDYLQMREFPIQVWTAKSLQVLWYDDWKSLVDFKLSRSGNYVAGRITNESHFDLKHCVLVTPSHHYYIGDLDNGRSIAVDSNVEGWKENPEAGFLLFQGAPQKWRYGGYDRNNTTPAGRIDEEHGGGVFERFMDFDPDPRLRPQGDFFYSRSFYVRPAKYYLKRILREGRWVFFAYLEENPLDVRAKGGRPVEKSYTLIRFVGHRDFQKAPWKEDLEGDLNWKMVQGLKGR